MLITVTTVEHRLLVQSSNSCFYFTKVEIQRNSIYIIFRIGILEHINRTKRLPYGPTMVFPVAWPSMLLAEASSASLRVCLESITVFSFPSFTNPTRNSRLSRLGINISGTMVFVETAGFFGALVISEAGPGDTSMTFPWGPRLGSKVDQWMLTVQWTTTSYFGQKGPSGSTDPSRLL